MKLSDRLRRLLASCHRGTWATGVYLDDIESAICIMDSMLRAENGDPIWRSCYALVVLNEWTEPTADNPRYIVGQVVGINDMVPMVRLKVPNGYRDQPLSRSHYFVERTGWSSRELLTEAKEKYDEAE